MTDPITIATLLTPTQARILGALVEKANTTPDVYPLTLNAVVLACNQKTARDPVMSLEPGDVGHALRQLESDGWVKSDHGARAARYAHRFDTKLSLTRAQAALLALLALRGAQTAGELMVRSERMAKFDAVGDVEYALERLAQREPALVRQLPRQSGQREHRYGHLLTDEPVAAAPADAAAIETTGGSSTAQRLAALEARVSELEARIAALEPDATR